MYEDLKPILKHVSEKNAEAISKLSNIDSFPQKVTEQMETESAIKDALNKLEINNKLLTNILNQLR